MSTTGRQPVRVGIVGCGVISRTYLANLTRIPSVDVVACGDLQPERAREAAEFAGVPVWGGPEVVIGESGVDLTVNLTVPAAHAAVSLAALRAGQHVYGEKPIASSRAELAELVAAAAQSGRRVGSAPDTFLGAGIQSAARLIAAGAIGRPLSALLGFQGPGPQRWHPAPEFLFAAGGGPLLDMGPYYLTALVTLLGPVRRVGALTSTATTERVIGAGPRAGTSFPVEVPTHVTALIELASDAVVTSVFSFDSVVSRTGFVEINGTEGALRVPDPNRFDGPLRLRRPDSDEWEEVPTTGTALGRGIGVAEMVEAIAEDRPHRADAGLAGHVLDTLLAMIESGASSGFVPVDSTCSVPAPVAADWDPLTGAAPAL